MTSATSPENTRTCSAVAISSVTDLAGIAALQPDYERLCRVTGNRLPFALHDWHWVWCQHFLNHDPRIRDEPLFYIMRDTHGACVAILPFIVSRRRLGPMKIVSIDLLGADNAITEIRSPLVERGYEHAAVAAVRDALSTLPHWDWIHWTGARGEFAAALKAGNTLKWQAPLSDCIIDLPPTWEELRARLKRNIRESLRHCYNSLKRNGIRFEFEVIEHPAQIRPGLDRFLVLHRMRARLTHTVVHPDRFSSLAIENFLYAVCERLAARGAVRLFALKIGSETVAMRLAFAVGDSLYLYYSGFDPRWGRYGVMTTALAEAIKYAIANGFRTVNLSPTIDISKTRWSPRQVDYGSAYEPRRRLVSRLANSAYLKVRTEESSGSKFLQWFVAPRRWD